MIVEFQFGLIAPSDSSEILKYPEKDKSEGAVQQELGQTQKPSEETPIRGTGRSRATHRFNFSRSEEKFLSFFCFVSIESIWRNDIACGRSYLNRLKRPCWWYLWFHQPLSLFCHSEKRARLKLWTNDAKVSVAVVRKEMKDKERALAIQPSPALVTGCI